LPARGFTPQWWKYNAKRIKYAYLALPKYMDEETAEEKEFGRKVMKGFCLLLLIAGILLYLSWGLLFNVWADIGLYSMVVLLVGFGLIGTILYSIKDEEKE
jgi:hypothetical protein